jgi:hypothetical protein
LYKVRQANKELEVELVDKADGIGSKGNKPDIRLIDLHITREFQTLHVMDDARRVAMVETTISDDNPPPGAPMGPSGVCNSTTISAPPSSSSPRLATSSRTRSTTPFGTTAFRAFDPGARLALCFSLCLPPDVVSQHLLKRAP